MVDLTQTARNRTFKHVTAKLQFKETLKRREGRQTLANLNRKDPIKPVVPKGQNSQIIAIAYIRRNWSIKVVRDGIIPLKLLLYRANILRLLNLPICLGTWPSIKLLDKKRTSRFSRLHISGGMLPPISLNSTSELQFPSSAGNEPSSLLSKRIRLTPQRFWNFPFKFVSIKIKNFKLQKTLENLWCNDSFKIVLRGDKHSKVLAITESKRKRSRKCILMNPKIRDCAGRNFNFGRENISLGTDPLK
ncbi:hypothetical protein NC651_028001 [Populus alba x Populus x berolinensis]|nr:hypothetical protein NC651_028001 [Populus alba x Populus x berolinensis]